MRARLAFFANKSRKRDNRGGTMNVKAPKNLRAAWRKTSSGALRAILEEPLPARIRQILKRELRMDLKRSACFADAIALVVVAKAMTGDVSAARELRHAVEGREGKRDEFVARPEPRIQVVWNSPRTEEAVRPAEPPSPVTVTHEDKTDAQENRGRLADGSGPE
jgi:hypothetical protein